MCVLRGKLVCSTGLPEPPWLFTLIVRCGMSARRFATVGSLSPISQVGFGRVDIDGGSGHTGSIRSAGLADSAWGISFAQAADRGVGLHGRVDELGSASEAAFRQSQRGTLRDRLAGGRTRSSVWHDTPDDSVDLVACRCVRVHVAPGRRRRRACSADECRRGATTIVAVAPPATPHPTLWQFLGADQFHADMAAKCQCMLYLLRPYFPVLDGPPPPAPIDDPANLEFAESGSQGSRQGVQKAEEDAPARRRRECSSIWAKVGCGCYPDVQEAARRRSG